MGVGVSCRCLKGHSSLHDTSLSTSPPPIVPALPYSTQRGQLLTLGELKFYESNLCDLLQKHELREISLSPLPLDGSGECDNFALALLSGEEAKGLHSFWAPQLGSISPVRF